MGQLIIEVPQEVNRFYHFEDVSVSEQLLQDLEKLERRSQKTLAIIPPRRDSLKEDGDAVLGIWSNRAESADEIAGRIRVDNRKIT